MWSLLEEAQREGWLVNLKREGLDDSLRGFVAAVSANLLVLSVVDLNCRFDGAKVLETEAVAFLEWDTDFLRARARLIAESPTSPVRVTDIDLTSWESVIRTVAAREPIMTLHRERLDPSIFHVGTSVSIEGEYVRAQEVSVDGIISGHFALRLSDLTQIEFGDGYELALWQMTRP